MDQEHAHIEFTSITRPGDPSSYADSAATIHCLHTKSLFVPGTLQPCEPRTVLLANKASVLENQTVDVLILFQNSIICLHRMLYVPHMR